MVTNEFIEKLEELVVQQQKCEIIFSRNGGKVILHERIAHLQERDDTLVLQLQTGFEIPLDMLLMIDGVSVENIC